MSTVSSLPGSRSIFQVKLTRIPAWSKDLTVEVARTGGGVARRVGRGATAGRWHRSD